MNTLLEAWNRFLAYIGFQMARLHFRNAVDPVQPLTEFFSGARSMLVVLPVGYEEAILAAKALHDFRDKLGHLHMTVVNTGTRMTTLVGYPKCQVIRLDPPDINRFALPTRPLLERVLHHEYDVALDLNLDFVLHAAYICKASRAKVRVGFIHPAADLFYNVQLQVTSPRTPEAFYEKYAACLAMF